MSLMPDDSRDWSGFVSTAGILGGLPCGLAVVLPHGTGLAAQIGQFIRYALIGIWTVHLAPIVFLRTGLALSPQDGDCVSRSEKDTKGPHKS